MKCSVIIPVFNNLHLTTRCIESIASKSYFFKESEVIIVDDGSDDGTAAHFTKFSAENPWLIYHRNTTNLKFAKSCNAGAHIAKGGYLIFLNNDTVVTENWDKFLLEPLEKDRDTWMTGAKLLYPDGTLQHAGVYLPELQKSSFSHVYRGFPSYFPPADVEKELQCVTAACMTMRKADFMDLGGFDTSYLNGLEDVDLCLRIIEKGKKIKYQPASQVIHFESKSEGRYANSKQNAELFYNRWKDRMKPDMASMIKKDISDCLENGKLAKVFELKAPSPGKIEIPTDNAGNYDDLLIVIGCISRGKAEARLTCKTKSGYDDRGLFDSIQPITEGENLILFNQTATIYAEKPSLVFQGDAAGLEIKAVTAYGYSNPEKKNSSYKILESTGKTTAKDLNQAIASCNEEYILILEKGMSVKPEFLVNAVEIMELQPKIGFIYSDIILQDDGNSSLIKLDFNPLTLLSKGITDMVGLFRKKCWESHGGFDENLQCFIQADLFLGIMASGNWKGYKTKYTAFEKTEEKVQDLFDYKSERDNILSKYTRYLLKECGAAISREKQVAKMAEKPGENLPAPKKSSFFRKFWMKR